MRLFYKKYIHNDSGAAVVETAIVLPILVTLVALVFELGMYILLESKLVRMAGVISDAVTRQNLTSTALTGIMDTANTITTPFNFNLNGKMVISQVRNNNQTPSPNNMRISWQQSKNGGVSLLGTVGSLPTNLPGDIVVTKEQTMVITEVFYQYSPLIFKDFMSVKSLYVTAVFTPRVGDMNVLLT